MKTTKALFIGGSVAERITVLSSQNSTVSGILLTFYSLTSPGSEMETQVVLFPAGQEQR